MIPAAPALAGALFLFAVGLILGAMVPAPGFRLRQTAGPARIDSAAIADRSVYWQMHGYDERGRLRSYLLTQYEIDRIRKRARSRPEDA